MYKDNLAAAVARVEAAERRADAAERHARTLKERPCHWCSAFYGRRDTCDTCAWRPYWPAQDEKRKRKWWALPWDVLVMIAVPMFVLTVGIAIFAWR